MAVREIPVYQYRKYEFSDILEEFKVSRVSNDIVIESDDFRIIMDFSSFQELRGKCSDVKIK